MNKLILLMTLATATLLGQGNPVNITPYQVLDARSGQAVACVGCKLFSYSAGTSTPLATYTDNTLEVTNSNPVIMDAAGYASNGSSITGVWVGQACYKFRLEDASGVTIWTQDFVCNPPQIQALSLNGLNIVENPVPPAYGGYIDLIPITYNPYNGSPCVDIYGNPVQQPLVAPVLPTFGPNDLLLWNGTSPVMPANGSCGAPLPVNTVYGINTNGYMYARAGFATDIKSFNGIQNLEGGMWAKNYTSVDYVDPGFYDGPTAAGPPNLWGNVGTVNTSGTAVTLATGPAFDNAFLAPVFGGFIRINGTPYSIASITDSSHLTLTTSAGTQSGVSSVLGGWGLGSISYSSASNCVAAYISGTWNCLGSGGGGGGSPTGPSTSVQFNNSGSFNGSSQFTWQNTNQTLCVGVTGSICTVNGVGVVTITFESTATSTTVAFGTQTGTAAILGNGQANFNTLNVGTGCPGSCVFTVSSAGLAVTAGGLISTLVAFNTIQTTVGGMAARTFTATDYTAIGTYSGATASGPANPWSGWGNGSLSWSSASTCVAFYNGSTWACLSGGGGVTWPTSGDIVVSNGTNTPAGLAPVNGDCVVGAGGVWTAGSCAGGGGAVNSVTGIGVITNSASTGVVTLTVAGTSGGVVYFNSASSWASSGALGSTQVVLGGGAGGAPNTSANLTFGSNILTVGPTNTAGTGIVATTFNSSAVGSVLGWQLGGGAGYGLGSGEIGASFLRVGTGLPGGASLTINNSGVIVTTGGMAVTLAAFNSIQSSGGMSGLTINSQNYVFPGSYSTATAAGPSTPWGTSGLAGAISYSIASGCIAVFNGGSWTCLSGGGGGGGVTSISTAAPLSGGPITTSGTISCPTCVITLSSFKNTIDGFSQFIGGCRTITTSYSNVVGVANQATGGAPSEFVGVSVSGPSVTFCSSNASSSAFFHYHIAGF